MSQSVVVSCLARGNPEDVTAFPNVRAICLAKYLKRIGVTAEYIPLPNRRIISSALVWSEYQRDQEYLDASLLASGAVKADRYFCITNTGISTSEPYRRAATEWFANRGGVLVHLSSSPLGDNENHIGVGVDIEALHFEKSAKRDGILFDFPSETWRYFSLELLHQVRAAFPKCRFIGSGPSEATFQGFFDEWHSYGRNHWEFVQMYRGCAAFIPGCPETLGYAVAEAQLSGACVVAPIGWVKREMLCAEAKFNYVGGASSLCEGIGYSLGQNPQQIVSEAREKFDPWRMARRVADVLGISPRPVLCRPSSPSPGVTGNGVFILSALSGGAGLVASLVDLCGVSGGVNAHAEGALDDLEKSTWRYPLLDDFCLEVFNSVEPGVFTDVSVAVRRLAENPVFRERASELIQHMERGGRHWFWANERLTTLLPFWSEFTHKKVYLFVAHDPAKIALSKRKETGLFLRSSLYLWQSDICNLFEQIEAEDAAVLVVQYESLLANPQNECERIFRFLRDHLGPLECAPNYLHEMVYAVSRVRVSRMPLSIDDLSATTETQKALISFLTARARDSVARFDRSTMGPPEDWKEQVLVDMRRGIFGECVA